MISTVTIKITAITTYVTAVSVVIPTVTTAISAVATVRCFVTTVTGAIPAIATIISAVATNKPAVTNYIKTVLKSDYGKIALKAMIEGGEKSKLVYGYSSSDCIENTRAVDSVPVYTADGIILVSKMKKDSRSDFLMIPAYWTGFILRELLVHFVGMKQYEAEEIIGIGSRVLFNEGISGETLKSHFSKQIDELEVLEYFCSEYYGRLSVLDCCNGSIFGKSSLSELMSKLSNRINEKLNTEKKLKKRLLEPVPLFWKEVWKKAYAPLLEKVSPFSFARGVPETCGDYHRFQFGISLESACYKYLLRSSVEFMKMDSEIKKCFKDLVSRLTFHKDGEVFVRTPYLISS